MSQVPQNSRDSPDASAVPPVPPTQPSDAVPQSRDVPAEQGSITSRVKSLSGAEKYWVWKAGLRMVTCVLNIIGIGCVAWLLSSAVSLDDLYYYSFLGSGWQAGSIAIFCVSFIWCLIWILIPLLLKPSRPLHAGIAVGIDLILWLGFLLLGLLTVVVIYDVASFGDGDYIADPSQSYNGAGYYGDYYYVPSNNTWVYNITSVYSNDNTPVYNATTGEYDYPDSTDVSDVVRDCTPLFTTCEQQDEYINALWRQKPQRLATSVLADVVQWLNMLLHFTLFVWACVDTHRHNKRSSISKEKIIADRIIADLESKGVIAVKDGVVQPARSGLPEMATVAGPSRT